MAAVSTAGADRFRPHVLVIEWDDMVDAWQLDATASRPGSMISKKALNPAFQAEFEDVSGAVEAPTAHNSAGSAAFRRS